jgi:hypothetical protein
VTERRFYLGRGGAVKASVPLRSCAGSGTWIRTMIVRSRV